MKDKFTEKEVRAAYDAANRIPVTRKPFIDKVIEELTRSEPEFSEGQIFLWENEDGQEHFGKWKSAAARHYRNHNCREPNLTEHGKHVRDLRDAVERYLYTRPTKSDVYAPMFNALARFDAAVKDE